MRIPSLVSVQMIFCTSLDGWFYFKFKHFSLSTNRSEKYSWAHLQYLKVVLGKLRFTEFRLSNVKSFRIGHKSKDMSLDWETGFQRAGGRRDRNETFRPISNRSMKMKWFINLDREFFAISPHVNNVRKNSRTIKSDCEMLELNSYNYSL